jgi:hypothetical protein
VALDEILCVGYAIEGNLDAILFKPRSFNHSKIADVKTSEAYAMKVGGYLFQELLVKYSERDTVKNCSSWPANC